MNFYWQPGHSWSVPEGEGVAFLEEFAKTGSVWPLEAGLSNSVDIGDRLDSRELVYTGNILFYNGSYAFL